jgi:hypothetical protein
VLAASNSRIGEGRLRILACALWRREAHSRRRERALALRQFHACRALLRRELGIEPSGETRQLYQELLEA